MNHLEAIEEYQCPGCVNGPNPASCPQFALTDSGCENHHPGTFMSNVGGIMLGMPKGFNRTNDASKCALVVDSGERPFNGGMPEKFNVPVWRMLDKHGNTLLRVYSPRTDYSRVEVYLGREVYDRLAHVLDVADFYDEMD